MHCFTMFITTLCVIFLLKIIPLMNHFRNTYACAYQIVREPVFVPYCACWLDEIVCSRPLIIGNEDARQEGVRVLINIKTTK